MYIRTKDGVYEVEQSQLEDDEEVVNCDYGQIHKLEILRKSENLEELCDRAFAFHKDSPWESPDLEDFSLDSLKEQILESTENSIDEFIFKLAIWTPKGLIYVAKMDNEGKLVLI